MVNSHVRRLNEVEDGKKDIKPNMQKQMMFQILCISGCLAKTAT